MRVRGPVCDPDCLMAELEVRQPVVCALCVIICQSAASGEKESAKWFEIRYEKDACSVDALS